MRSPLLPLLLASVLIGGAAPLAYAMEKRANEIASEMRNPATLAITRLPHAARIAAETRFASHRTNERSHRAMTQPLAACCLADLAAPEPTVIVITEDTAARAEPAPPAPPSPAAKSHDAPPSSETVAGVTIIRGSGSSSR